MDQKKLEELASSLEEALYSIRRAHLMVDDDSELKNSEKQILWYISQRLSEGAVKPSDISSKSGVTMAAVTHCVNALESRGYVERTRSSQDRRVVLIELTSKGRSYIKQLKQDYWENLCALVEHLGEEDTSRLINIIDKILGFIIGSQKGLDD